MATGAMPDLDNVTALSWFFVFKADDTSGEKYLTSSGITGATTKWGNNTYGGTLYARESNKYPGFTFSDTDNRHIYSTVWNGVSGIQAWLDDTASSLETGTDASLGTHSTTLIGSTDRYPGNYLWNGQIAAFLVYDRALNATDREAVEAYLDDTYFTPPPPAR